MLRNLLRSVRHEYRNFLFFFALCRYKSRSLRQRRKDQKNWVFDDVVIRVINIPRRKDRATKIVRELSNMSITKFKLVSGVDGQAVFSEHLFSGKMGCAASHIQVLSDAKPLNIPILVIEDDLVFTQPFEQLEEIVNTFLADSALDLLLLDGSTVREKSISQKLKLVSDSVLTSAYLAKPRAILPLLDSFRRSAEALEKGYDLPIDHAWWTVQRWKLVTVAPKIPVCNQFSGQSDVSIA